MPDTGVCAGSWIVQAPHHLVGGAISLDLVGFVAIGDLRHRARAAGHRLSHQHHLVGRIVHLGVGAGFFHLFRRLGFLLIFLLRPVEGWFLLSRACGRMMQRDPAEIVSEARSCRAGRTHFAFFSTRQAQRGMCVMSWRRFRLRPGRAGFLEGPHGLSPPVYCLPRTDYITSGLASDDLLPSSARRSTPQSIPLAQDGQVMAHVASHEERERAHGLWVFKVSQGNATRRC